MCTISEECFTIPSLYRRLSHGRGGIADEEEQLLQLAIRQSLLDQGGGGEGDGGGGEEDREGSGGRDGEVREEHSFVRRRDYFVRSTQTGSLAYRSPLPQELSLTEALKDEGLLTTGNSRHQK